MSAAAAHSSKPRIQQARVERSYLGALVRYSRAAANKVLYTGSTMSDLVSRIRPPILMEEFRKQLLSDRSANHCVVRILQSSRLAHRDTVQNLYTLGSILTAKAVDRGSAG